MSNITNLTARLQLLAKQLIEAEHDESAKDTALSMFEDSIEGLASYEYDNQHFESLKHELYEAQNIVDDINNEIENIEDEMERLCNEHDNHEEDAW
jgi:uncharacterized protein YukE